MFSEKLRLTGSLDMQFRREDGTIVVRVKSYIPAKIVADTNAHICFSLFYTDHGLEEVQGGHQKGVRW